MQRRKEERSEGRNMKVNKEYENGSKDGKMEERKKGR